MGGRWIGGRNQEGKNRPQSRRWSHLPTKKSPHKLLTVVWSRFGAVFGRLLGGYCAVSGRVGGVGREGGGGLLRWCGAGSRWESLGVAGRLAVRLAG